MLVATDVDMIRLWSQQHAVSTRPRRPGELPDDSAVVVLKGKSPRYWRNDVKCATLCTRTQDTTTRDLMLAGTPYGAAAYLQPVSNKPHQFHLFATIPGGAKDNRHVLMRLCAKAQLFALEREGIRYAILGGFKDTQCTTQEHWNDVALAYKEALKSEMFKSCFECVVCRFTNDNEKRAFQSVFSSTA